MSNHDPFQSIDAAALEGVGGGTQRVAGAASRNNDMNDAVDEISDTLAELQDGGGNSQMMMMMMMMLANGGLGGGAGRTIKTGGLMGATSVSG